MSSNQRRERPPPRQALKLTLAYDGRGFGGSQRQANARSVQGELERAVEVVVGVPVRTYFAGRTDQGVHAAGQVASLADFRPDLSAATLLRALNAHLPDDVAVIAVERRPLGFHAQHAARRREYRYRVWTGVRPPHAVHYVWHRPGSLDRAVMERAAVRLIGTHDFAAFAGGGEGVPWSARQQRPRGTTRTVFACDAVELAPWWGPPPTVGQLIEIRVAADGFLPRMVRTIVGTLVEIGRGARPVDWIDELLIARDRRRGAPAAPPRGLVLWSVDYDDAAAADGRDAHPVAPSEAEGSF